MYFFISMYVNELRFVKIKSLTNYCLFELFVFTQLFELVFDRNFKAYL